MGADNSRAYDALLRTNLSAFTQKTFHTVDPGAPYLHNWHIDAISEFLMACYTREIKRGVINVPPRYMKSISCSTAFPAWGLGRDPRLKFMVTSYADRLSLKLSMDTRLTMTSAWYKRLFPGTILASDQNEKGKFVTTERGQRLATTMQGSATGEGCNFLIVDDPHNVKKAFSDKEREKDVEMFDQTFTSRLNNKKEDVILIVMQRLHEKDLTGHVLEQGGYEQLEIPAECERRTLISIGNFTKVREKGELLHPEREGPEEITRRKRELGSYGYAAQYLQSPTPLDGGIFKRHWFPRHNALPVKPKRIVISCDTANKASELNDPSAMEVYFEDETTYKLAEVVKDRLEYPDLKRTVISLWDKYFNKYKQKPTLLIEDKASGQSLIQDLKRDPRKIPIIGILPEADKLTRAATQSPKVEGGLVSLPENAPWLADFEREIFLFPNSATKDQVDALTQFLKWSDNAKKLYDYAAVIKKAGGFNKKGAW